MTKTYIEYLETASLVRVARRIDRSAEPLGRAIFFEVYLANPSKRNFLEVTQGDAVLEAVPEAATFFQQVDYGKWKRGEVDLVTLTPDRRAERALEARWSNRSHRHLS